MKFIVDCMLGKLAKWLRMLGYDTKFILDADDDDLVRIAVKEDRILLTRDSLLCMRRMVRNRCIFIDWGKTSDQVKQVFSALNLAVIESNMFTRCTICNEQIKHIDKSDVKGKVPSFVYKTQNEYGCCVKCDKIYWRGTHVQHVFDALKHNSGVTK